MTERTIEWWTPVLGRREKELLAEVIDSNYPNDGAYTARFEKKIAEICDLPHAVAVTSGTAALFVGLVACGVGPGDEVIVPDITFIATANAVKLAGATPVFVDVLPETLCIDPARVRAAITARTKAIVPVHVSGRAAAIGEILAIAREKKLKVVEDAAEGLGSKLSGKALGSFGDVGCFSFAANKTITMGQGGVVVTRDAALYSRLKELKDQGRPVRGTGGADEHVSLGFNFKLTNLQAAVGLAQLEDLPTRLEHQRRLYRLYKEHLSGVSRVRLPKFDVDGGEVPQWVDAVVEGRDSLHDFLEARKVQCRKFWFPLHTQAPYRDRDDKFPASVNVGKTALWFPSALNLADDDVVKVAHLVKEWSSR